MIIQNCQQNVFTGYPSIDKPWLKYYSEEAINSSLPNCSLYDYLYKSNKENFTLTALNYFGNKISYQKMFRDIDRIASAFLANNVKAEDIVTIVSISSAVSVLCMYALNRIGAVVNYVNVLADEKDLRRYFEEAHSEVVVTLDLFGEKVVKASQKSCVSKIVCFSLGEYMPFFIRKGYEHKVRKIDKGFEKNRLVISWKNFLACSSDEKIEYVKDPETLCMLGHTGGTTGTPKGVLLNDNELNAVAHQYKMSMKHETGEVFLNTIVPFVVYGSLVCLHMPLCLGLEVVIVPKFEAKDWKKYLTRNKPAHIAGIPSYVVPMLTDSSLDAIDMSFIKTLAVGGDGLNDKLEKDVNCFLKKHGASICITKGYGMTELCATAVTGYNYCNKVGSVGIPLIKNNVMVFDNESNHELTYNKIGEICINSPSLMMGYLNNDSEFNKLVRIHDDGKRWVHTGDLGYVDTDGLIYISGRMKRMIFLGPEGMLYKVFPKMIEDVINSVENVKESCVVSKKSNKSLDAVAYVILKQRNEQSSTTQAILSACKEQLPDYMVPKKIVYLGAFLYTDIGKVDYKELERLANNQ